VGGSEQAGSQDPVEIPEYLGCDVGVATAEPLEIFLAEAQETAVFQDVDIGRAFFVEQAGLSDHIEVGDRVMIAARSGVNRSLTGNQIVSGAPAMPHEVSIKAQAVVPRLPELRQQVRDLERRVRELESRAGRANRGSKKSKGTSKK